MNEAETVARIFNWWNHRLGGELQGACAIVAAEIYFELACKDEDVVGGYLTSATGWRRPHWWIEKDGKVYDPMGDEYRNEPGFKREVAHRGDWKDFVAEYRRQKENVEQ